MRLQNLLIISFVVTPTLCVADESISVSAAMSARSACVESLRGLGSGSIIFDAPTKGGDSGAPIAIGEMIWDAQLVTESGQIVRVQLHCARSELPAIQDKVTSGRPLGFVSELIRH